MKVQVRMFALARQLAGRDRVELELEGHPTIADLRKSLAAEVPELARLLPGMLFAVDTRYATDDTPLSTAREIACFPPVSGG